MLKRQALVKNALTLLHLGVSADLETKRKLLYVKLEAEEAAVFKLEEFLQNVISNMHLASILNLPDVYSFVSYI